MSRSESWQGYLRLPRILGGGFSTRKGLDGLPALWVFLAAAGFALEAAGFAAAFFVVLFLSSVGMVSRGVMRAATVPHLEEHHPVEGPGFVGFQPTTRLMMRPGT